MSPAHTKSEKRLQNRDRDPWKVLEQVTGVLASGGCSNICLEEFVVYQGRKVLLGRGDSVAFSGTRLQLTTTLNSQINKCF